jgi:hypothetical protein
MARPSSIDRLPEEVRELIGRLRQGGRTIDEIILKLRELDVQVSRSALGRHTAMLDKLGERLAQSRQLQEALIARLGQAGESRQTRFLAELVGAGMFQALSDAESLTPGEQAQLARAVRDLGSALRADVDYTERLRGLAVAEARAQAAADAAASPAMAGLSAGTVEAIKAAILGVAA